MIEFSGEMTTVTPGLHNAGNWYQSDLPPPVGIRMRQSWQSKLGLMACNWFGRNLFSPKLSQSVSWIVPLCSKLNRSKTPEAPSNWKVLLKWVTLGMTILATTSLPTSMFASGLFGWIQEAGTKISAMRLMAISFPFFHLVWPHLYYHRFLHLSQPCEVWSVQPTRSEPGPLGRRVGPASRTPYFHKLYLHFPAQRTSILRRKMLTLFTCDQIL